VTNPEPKLLWYATNHLALLPAPGAGRGTAEPKLLTRPLDRNVRRPRFAPDSASIYFRLEDSGEEHLARIPVGGGTVTRPLAGPRVVSAFSVGPEGTIAALVSDPQHPEEVFVMKGVGEARQLTNANKELLDEVRLGEVEETHFNSKDGTPIEAFVVKPPGFSPEMRFPGLLRIHGGPVSQHDRSFDFEAQLFAANGYVVVLPNPRGSSGYGQDFSRAIFAAWGVKDTEDVLAAVDDIVARGYADPNRLGVGGWSYGGILTNYVISQTDRFKAAISGAGGALWTGFYGHDHYQLEYEVELGLPWRNREVWDKLSSAYYNVEKITTPTLYMGGSEDWNVPILGSEQMYQALRRLGRTTQLVVYPGQHHGIRKPTYQKDRYERYLAWYDKYVKGTGDKKTAAR
jgi:dipeptidyl aminopeptidase/acylaminoacyl peptidase